VAVTYAQLLQRIANRLNRDDLDTVIREVAEETITYYQREVFYSAQVTDNSITTTPGIKWYDFPSGWDRIDQVKILQGNAIWLDMIYIDYARLNSMDNIEPGIRSVPRYWSPYGSPNTPDTMAVRLFPTPGTTYRIELTMDKAPGIPADTASNFWTQDALRLILSATIAKVCAQHINDPIRQKSHEMVEAQEKLSLMSRSIRASGGLRVRPYF
jgi:hypothetical protein